MADQEGEVGELDSFDVVVGLLLGGVIVDEPVTGADLDRLWLKVAARIEPTTGG